MSIRAKLVFGFGVLVTITLVQGGAAYRGMLIVDNSASENRAANGCPQPGGEYFHFGAQAR
jgi:CHASE3 domain sensor protein